MDTIFPMFKKDAICQSKNCKNEKRIQIFSFINLFKMYIVLSENSQ